MNLPTSTPRRPFSPFVTGLAACVAIAANGPACSAQISGGFRDVPANHWAAQSVAKLAAAGIIKGYPSAPFAPAPPAATATPAGQNKASGYNGDKPVTRYELAVTLYRFVQYIERANKQPKGKLPINGAPKSGPQAVQALIAAGYLPANTPLATEGNKAVTAKQLSAALARVILKTREHAAPVSPDSEQVIEKPGEVGA
ncbi:MAG: S-layer homology domain-containing protein [Cytophagales bacterium]|nr:S-layer homology domain-containing protein [Armatimonadota bacterium]